MSTVDRRGFDQPVAGLVWPILSATLTGLVIWMLGKLWFIDRMVWVRREQARDVISPRTSLIDISL